MRAGLDGQLIISASDLVGFSECRHMTWRGLEIAAGRMDRPSGRDPFLELLAQRGLAHEAEHLESLGDDVVEIAEPRTVADLRVAADATLDAMRAGSSVIFQATLFDGQFEGRADFLVRVEGASDLGDFHYEAHDTKVARSVKPSALLQLAHYSWQLERLQGRAPELMHVVLGNGEIESVPYVDVAPLHDEIRADVLDFVASTPEEPYPDPVARCSTCMWKDVCSERRAADDHLSLVFGMRKDHAKKLVGAGVETMSALAEFGGQIPKFNPGVLRRLKHQAELQSRGHRAYEVVDDDESGRAHGLSMLPEPSEQDLFFDLEGFPLADPSLEYLWGWTDSKDRYTRHWGHDREAELTAARALVAEVRRRREIDPAMHVYHYAPYEKTVMSRLAADAGVDLEWDEFLRDGVFVDLYQVVRNGIRISEGSYSIKKLEPFYGLDRDADVANGADSVVEYDRWLTSGEDALLADIARYNEEDCVSTRMARDWLEGLRVSAGIERAPEREPRSAKAQKSIAERIEADEQTQRLADRLRSARAESDADRAGFDLMADLLGFHRREARPEWFQHFRRLQLSDDEFLEDGECIGGVTGPEQVGEIKRSFVWRYDFDPNQDSKLKPGDSVLTVDESTTAEGMRVGDIQELDSVEGWLTVTRGKGSDPVPARVLLPGAPRSAKTLEEALMDLGRSVLEHGSGPGDNETARRLIFGLASRGGEVVEPTTASERVRSLVPALDRSHLAIQGPPGTGKTFTAAHLIADLIRDGKRVAVSAFSHAAMDNLLSAALGIAAERGVELRAGKVASGREVPDGAASIESNNVAAMIDDGELNLVAGTVWTWSRSELRDKFDVMIVDEAGQMSLANTAICAMAATDLVLFGDPQQLQQPVKGSHPEGADVSSLRHLMGEADTVPAHHGVLLDVSYRMRSELTEVVSKLSYDGRLTAAPVAAERMLDGVEPGVVPMPIEHLGNRHTSSEEIEAVVELVNDLVGRSWFDADIRRPLTESDVLVVAPYNVHVRELQLALGDGVRVGTVDKFQGQEAPVVIYSTAVSELEEVPRGIDFLLDTNRLNVAISRAQHTAFVVHGARLLRTRPMSQQNITRYGRWSAAVRPSASAGWRALRNDVSSSPATVSVESWKGRLASG